MAKDWRTSYFLQAKSDYETFFQMSVATPLCQRLHYLQMTTEKYAKGFKTQPGAGPHAMTHQAFVSFMRLAKSDARLQRACEFANKSSFHRYVDSLIPLAQQIEQLSPDLAGNGPNPEYPWETHDGVIAPIEYAFDGLDLKLITNARLRKLLDFIARCFQIVE